MLEFEQCFRIKYLKDDLSCIEINSGHLWNLTQLNLEWNKYQNAKCFMLT